MDAGVILEGDDHLRFPAEPKAPFGTGAARLTVFSKTAKDCFRSQSRNSVNCPGLVCMLV